MGITTIRSIGKNICKIALSALLLTIWVDAIAQNDTHTVTGTVTDAETMNPLPGVNIGVQGTDLGTSSDLNGNYELTLPSPDETLVFSFVGFTMQEVNVEGRTEIDISLEPEVYFGEEVIVVGYGRQREQNVTGSISSISMDDLETRPFTQASQALQGQMSGVYALQESGRPRADGTVIRIRGEGTLNNSDPLVVIDGFPGSIDNVNPRDIQSITVLKDAASASIYGSRAANGVILIETKEGREGLEVTYHGQLGIQQPTQLPGMLNSVEYATLEREASHNMGLQPQFSEADIELFRDGSDPMYPDINYRDLMYDSPTYMHNHQFSFSGGTDNLRAYFMLGYLNQDGPLIANEGERVNFRTNLNASFLQDDRLRLTARLSGRREWSLAPTMDWWTRWYANVAPIHPIRNADGEWASIFGEQNFYAEAVEGSHERHYTSQFDGQLTGVFEIVRGFEAEISYGYRILEDRFNTFRANVLLDNLDGTTKSVESNLNEHFDENKQTMFNSLLRYSGMWERHELSLLAGYQQEYWDDHNAGASRSRFINNQQRVIGMGDPDTQTTYGGGSDLGMESVFGRVNYSFAGRYSVEANLRYDGSSRFAEGNQWGLFPSFSAGWNLAEEPMFENALSRFNMLRLRGSWGKLGNESIFSRYAATPILNTGQNYVTGGSNLRAGVAMTSLANLDVTWETTTQTNIGLDMRMNVFRFSIDVFQRDTENILMQVPIPITMGNLAPPFQNVGEVQNRGIEFEGEYIHQFDNGLLLNTSLNLTHVRNEIKDLHGRSPIIDDMNIMMEGESMHSFYGYEVDGLYQIDDFIWQNGSDPGIPHYDRNYELKEGVTDVIHFTPQPGDLKFVDQDGDGIVTLDDRTVIGNQLPDLTFGINVNMAYRGFDFGMFLQGVTGIDGYTSAELVEPLNNFFNMGDWWLDRWTPENTNTDIPRVHRGDAARSNINSEFLMEDASYLRIKNIELGYSLPTRISNMVNANTIRVYGSVQNAYTFHNTRGFDPEQPTWETRAHAYPQVRIWNLGVTMRF